LLISVQFLRHAILTFGLETCLHRQFGEVATRSKIFFKLDLFLQNFRFNPKVGLNPQHRKFMHFTTKILLFKTILKIKRTAEDALTSSISFSLSFRP